MMTPQRLLILITGLLLMEICLSSNAQSIDQFLSAQPKYSFIENKGQIADQHHNPNGAVKFILPLPNNNVVLTATGFSYDTYITEMKERPNRKNFNGIARDKRDALEKDITYKYHRVDVVFEGANSQVEIVAEGQSTDYSNYYVGPEGNEVKVYHYNKVVYKNIYPGIDMEFLARPGSEKPVEYNFIVHPGADMDQIRLRYKGANASRLANGRLEMTLAHGKLTESIPASYWQKSQDHEDIRYKQISARRDEITVGFSRANNKQVEKRNEALIIDPTPNLDWGRYHGSNGEEVGLGVTMDASGNIFVVGYSTSANAIATTGTHQPIFAGENDAILLKVNSSGSLQWSTYYGGAGYDIGRSVKLDPSGNIIICGDTRSATSIATSGAHQETKDVDTDAFVVKFNSVGVRLWGTYYGGDGSELGSKIAVDASGNVFLVGWTFSRNSIAASGHQMTHGGGSDSFNGDGFLVKFNSNGVRQWGTYYGGTSPSESILSVATDASGNVYVTGGTESSGPIATSGAFKSVISGGFDAFLVKFSSSGVRQWGTYYGGPDYDVGWDMTVDGSGNIYCLGTTASGSSIAMGAAYQNAYAGGGQDAFVVKFNSSGTPQWATYLGGPGYEENYGSITTDASGNVIVTTGTSSVSSIATSNAHQTTLSGGPYDALVVKFNSNGAHQWGTYYGGSGEEIARGIVADASQNVYITGGTTSTSSISTPGVQQATSGGGMDVFIAKFNSCLSGNVSATELNCDICAVASRCIGPGTTQFSSTTTNASSVEWTIADNNASLSNAISQTGLVTWDPAFSGQATITLTAKGCGPTVTHTKTITVNPLASASELSCDICGVGSRCIGPGTTQFTSTITGTPAWSISGNNPEVSNTISSTGLVTWNPSFSGQATITLTVTGCGPTVTRTKTITVTPLASASELSCGICSVGSRCIGSGTTQFTSTTSGTPTWSISDDNPEVSNTISSTGLVTWNPSFTGQATITLTVTGCGSPVTRTKVITVNPLVSASELSCDICGGSPPTRCQAPGTTQFSSAIVGSSSWSISDDNPEVSNAISSSGLVTWDPNFSGQATITLTVTGCGGPVTRSRTITVTPSVSASELSCDICGGELPSRCQGGGTTQLSSAISNAGTEEWTISDDNPEISNTISSAGMVTWNPSFSGQATITLTVTGCGGPLTRTKTITVNPTVSASPLSCDMCEATFPSRCEGAGSTQFISEIGNASVVTWTITDDNPAVSNTISTEGLVAWNPSFEGQAIVTLTAEGCGEPVTRSRTVTVKGSYYVPALTLHGPSFVCPGSEAAFDITIVNGSPSTQVEFLINDQLLSSGTATSFLIPEWNYENGSTVRCRIPNPNECQVAQGPESKLVTVYTQMEGVVEILPDDEGFRCKGPGTTQFTPSANLTDYIWSIEYADAGTFITQSGLVTWDPNETGAQSISIAAHDCPAVKTSAFYGIQDPPPTPADQTATGCNWETITLKAYGGTGNSINWYDNDHELVHTGDVFDAGVFPIVSTNDFFTESVTPQGCKSEDQGHVQLIITSTSCDDNKLNWIETKAMDATPDIYSHSKQYFDLTGKSLQNQTKMFSHQDGAKILVSQGLRDRLGREVSSTLTAPVLFSNFQYYFGFVLSETSAPYGFQDFDGAKLNNPDPVSDTESGTLGWYYSSNNTMEDHVPGTGYPYSRTEFYEDGTGEVKRQARPGDQHRLGSGHEIISGTFPVFSELNDYLSKRTLAIPGILQDGSLTNEGVQSVVRDENGKYSISISDKAGKAVMTCRPGTISDHVLAITNTVTSSGNPESSQYRVATYFYILHDQAVSISGAYDFVAENIVTNERKPAGLTFANTQGKWPAGFYRILLNNPSSQVTIGYTNYFLDVSCQFYDDAGRLVSSVSPNGYKAWSTGTNYNLIDKTTYEYNYEGLLLTAKEPDAGSTHYVYRRDGKIRFSQNSEQGELNRFSYTHYDKLGRPVESGEYLENSFVFVAMDDAGYHGSFMQQELEKTAGQTTLINEKKDWVKTHYDFPVTSISNLPTAFQQQFVRGAVSWTENENIKTWYSYDELGRVTWMAQKPNALNRTFVTQYTYDFLGNVLTASNASYVGETAVNPFYHHYEYDADKRLSKMYTSADGSNKKLRATYEYYLHGPLKRIELGDQIQGIDFVYNINGWLTQINHPDKAQDPGGDTNDAFGMVLDYYESAMNSLFQLTQLNPIERELYRIHGLPELNVIQLGSSYAFQSGKDHLDKPDLMNGFRQVRHWLESNRANEMSKQN